MFKDLFCIDKNKTDSYNCLLNLPQFEYSSTFNLVQVMASVEYFCHGTEHSILQEKNHVS